VARELARAHAPTASDTVPVELIRDRGQLAVAGGNRNFPGQDSTVDVTRDAGRTDSVARTFAVSPVSDGQALTTAP
jgi:hypothetical protein